MIIKVDDETILELSETQKKVIMNDILSDEFDADMKRRVKYILIHKYKKCFERLKIEWDKKLKDRGVKSIPLDQEEYAQLVFSQNDYLDRKKRDQNLKSNELMV